MGRENSDTSASDQSPPRKARRMTSHKSSSSSTAQKPLGPIQESTQSEKKIESTQDSGWTPINSLSQSEIQHCSLPSLAPVQRRAKPNQDRLPERKLRTLAPAPTVPPSAPAPRPLKEVVFVDENGRHKRRLPRPCPPANRNVPASSLAKPTTTAPPPKQASDIPITCSEPFSSEFDPSECVWHALRDVAFVKEEKIDLSMEDLCALLRFRYSDKDPRMKGLEERHVLAMREFVGDRGRQMYETRFPRFIKREMEVDLRSMREG